MREPPFDLPERYRRAYHDAEAEALDRTRLRWPTLREWLAGAVALALLFVLFVGSWVLS